MDFIEAATKDGTIPLLTVSELTREIARVLENEFPFVWVTGEISNLRIPSSGHMYFTLKDQFAQIRAVCFRGTRPAIRFSPKDGMEVICFGRISLYQPRGEYQIIVEIMEPRGLGALQAAFEELKKKLFQEGLFDEARKKPLPLCPKHILVVTSPTGAAIRDILRILKSAPLGVSVTLLPVQVQGEVAPAEIVKAIEWINENARAFPWDVVIVGRGGGSIEDLWAFNDEGVARAVAGCVVPTISAVGHEIDYTICDFVADCRAPTPTAAAEIIVKRQKEILEKAGRIQATLITSILHLLDRYKNRLDFNRKRLRDPQRWVDDKRLYLDDRQERIIRAVKGLIEGKQRTRELLEAKLMIAFGPQKIEEKKRRLGDLYRELNRGIANVLKDGSVRLKKAETSLRMLSPYRVLERGYAIVTRSSDGTLLKEASGVEVGEEVNVLLASGGLRCTVNERLEGVEKFDDREKTQ